MSNQDGLSEQEPGIEDDAPEADLELAGGEDLGDEAPPETESEPDYDYLELDDDLASKYVRVKVDGEDVSVPLNEALSGYSRTQDYTRKTQELAQQRQEAEHALRLSQAFEANPGLTVQVLANQAGMSIEDFIGLSQQQQQRVADDTVPDWDDDEYVDPSERTSRQAMSRVEALEQRLAQQEADRELERITSGLKAQFGATDDDVRAVVQNALHNGYGPEAFPMIYQSMQFQKMQAQQRAQAEAGQQRQNQEQQRKAAAAKASQVVGAATGAASSGVAQGTQPGKPLTVREAINAAFEEHGDAML